MRSIHQLVDTGLEVATSDTSGATGLAVLGVVVAGAAAVGAAVSPQMRQCVLGLFELDEDINGISWDTNHHAELRDRLVARGFDPLPAAYAATAHTGYWPNWLPDTGPMAEAIKPRMGWTVLAKRAR